MKIKLYWPNCILHSGDIDFYGKDALFLECSLEEAKEQLFSRLTDGQIKQCLHYYKNNHNLRKSEFGETDKICFLITKDQKAILPEPWYLPFAGQWNAYNPFRKIKEIEIKDIGELTDLIVEVEEGELSGDYL